MKVIKRIVQVIVAISALAGIAAFIAERFEKRNSHQPYGIYEKYIKRPLDAFLSTGALIVLSPVLAITALLVKLKLGSPVIFTQERPGRDEKIFKLYKFRSMTDERDENGELLPDEVRLTSFGKKLRSTSLDELPELWNIVKGDMSIVGPRPLLVEYLPYYTKEEQHRHDVRPGLTGLAQVNGRNLVEWDQRLTLDVQYVRRITFYDDLNVILKTLYTVMSRKGIVENTSKVEGNLAQIRKYKYN